MINEFLKAQQGDSDALNKLFCEYRVIVEHEVRRARITGRYSSFDLEDLEQELNIALIECIKRFDISKDLSFYTYGIPSLNRVAKTTLCRNRLNKLQRTDENILMAMNKLKRKNPSITNDEICEELNINLKDLSRIYYLLDGITSLSQPLKEDDDMTINDTIEDSVDYMEQMENKVVLDGLLKILPKKEKDILNLYFYENKTQEEIGEIIGKTQTYVSRYIQRILKKIKKSCETLDNTLII